MPVRKFRSIEEMSAPQWRERGDPTLFRTMRALWEIGVRTSKRRYQPGVLKYASIEDMWRAQQMWSLEPGEPDLR
jgi:hypothetical protein